MKTRQLIIFTFVVVTCKCLSLFKKRNDDGSKRHMTRQSSFLDPMEMTNALMGSDTNMDGVLSAEEISNYFRFVIDFTEEDANSVALFLIRSGDEHGFGTPEKDGKLDRNELLKAVTKIEGQMTG